MAANGQNEADLSEPLQREAKRMWGVVEARETDRVGGSISRISSSPSSSAR